MRIILVVLLTLLPLTVSAQTVAGRNLTVGPLPTMPSGTTVRLDGLGTSGGTLVLFTDTEGDVFERILAVSDIPAGFARTDTANTWDLLQTFSSGISLNDGSASTPAARFTADPDTGLYRIGTNSLGISTGGVLRFTVNATGTTAAGTLTSTGAFTASSTSTLTGATTVGSTLGVTGATTLSSTLDVTGLSTFTGGFNSNAASAVNSTLTITGLTTAAKIKTTGLYAVADPLTFFATDSTTPLAYFYDAGRNVVTNSGNDTVWEYHGLGNASGSRVWRAGNIGGSYLIQSGNDAASVWTNLARSTMSAGVPNGWYWGTGVESVNPDLDFTTNLGAYATQYANLWIRNLWATTLVAQDVISTIGGAVLVTPTTTLEAAVSAVDTTFQTAHNEMVANDIAYINDNLATEFVQVTAGPLAATSSISYIGENEAVGTTVTLPTHQAGDLLLIFAFRNAATAPSLPADWISLCTASGTSTSVRVGYRIAPGSGTTTGTWTNATSIMAHVYRSSAGNMPAPGACAHGAAAASTSLIYPALTFSKTDHSSWVARAAISSAGTNIQTVPSGGFTLRSNNTAVPESASFDTNGRVAATSIAASSTITITSANWRAVTVEIVGIGLAPYSYTVTRGYGGTFAARAWPGGVSLANTGTTGDGGINAYAIQSIKGSGEQGPTIQGYERTSATYNALSTRWALGNLNGLYNYGAVDVYGAAFGDAADVWVGIDATNGVRFFDAGTTVNAHFALNGSILLGQTAAGVENLYMDNTQVQLRQGTTNLLRASSADGLQFYDTAGSLKMFLNATDGVVVGDTTGTNAYAQVSGGTFAVYQGIGNQRFVANTAGVTVGQTGASQSNVYIDASGYMQFRNGTSPRIQVDGSVNFFNPSGVGELFVGDFGGGVTGILIGEWVTANKPYISISDTAMSFCVSGGACPLTLVGTTGDITSSGNIVLSSGGNVTSTGEWSLTSTGGLSFSASTVDAGSTSRSVSWSGGSKIYEYSNRLSLFGATSMTLTASSSIVLTGATTRLTGGSLGTPQFNVAGSSIDLGVVGDGTAFASFGGSTVAPTMIPGGDGIFVIGSSSRRISNINLNLPSNTAPTYFVVNKGGAGGDASSALGVRLAGITTDIYVRDQFGTGTCYIEVTAGLITSHTCP